MSELLEKIRGLVESGTVRISEHGYDELSEDGISVREAVDGIRESAVVEEYAATGRGGAVLVLEYDRDGQPMHVVWGIPTGHESPAVLVTAYRPDPDKWDEGFTKRHK